MHRIALRLVALALVAAVGCDRDPASTQGPATPTSPPATATQARATKGHDDHAGNDHGKPEDHPNRVELGVQKVGPLELKATQDGPIKPGGEGAFDLVITGGKPKAVRFWVGTEDAKGSVKGKAEEETPDNWHTHVEVPDPLPPGSKFWAEVEPPTGPKFTISFDLKQQQ